MLRFVTNGVVNEGVWASMKKPEGLGSQDGREPGFGSAGGRSRSNSLAIAW